MLDASEKTQGVRRLRFYAPLRVVAGEGIEPSTIGYGPIEIPFLYPAIK